MKKALNLYSIVFALNLLVFSAVLVGNYFYQGGGFDFILKCLCSSGFALMGIINFTYALASKQKNVKFYAVMSLGLICALLGDALINSNFVFGAGVFALAHVFFIIGYCFLQKITLRDISLSLILCALGVAFLLLYPDFDFGSDIFKLVCIVYALIITSMLTKSLTNLIHVPSSATLSAFIGSLFFFTSDLMLVFAWFSSAGGWTNHLCMALYYPGVCLIALSTLLNCKKS